MVGISLLTLVPGLFGGSATYADALLGALAAVGELEYEVFLPAIAPDCGKGLPARVVKAYPASTSVGGRLWAMTRTIISPHQVREELGVDGLDALHYPLTVMVPPVDDRPTVATVHDVLQVVYPGFFGKGELAYRRLLYGRLVRSSGLVIAPSEHSKELLVDGIGVPAERIRVIPHGVDHQRFSPGEVEREPFVFYPADFYPHKNHERLIEAFAGVRRERPDLRLLLAGRDLERFAAASGVEVRARVSSDALVGLYRTAAALVFPSLHETFGLPPLEAMACGCPVASSKAGSLPEVCGDAAVYFDPESSDEIAAAILDVLTRANELSALGLRRAAEFDWERSARSHDDVYRELAARR
jgi:glycosyltransferase involved in cell wall biosynthesis